MNYEEYEKQRKIKEIIGRELALNIIHQRDFQFAVMFPHTAPKQFDDITQEIRQEW